MSSIVFILKNANESESNSLLITQVTADVSWARNLFSKVHRKTKLAIRNTRNAKSFTFKSKLAPVIYTAAINNTTALRVKRTNYYFKGRRGCKMRTTRTILKSIHSFSANQLLLAFTKCFKITNKLSMIAVIAISKISPKESDSQNNF